MTIYDIANDFSENTSRAIFLTGKAGTGKTTFLKNLRLRTRKQIAVVAPTGVAAINAEGVTMHSFFQLPLTPFVPTEEGKRYLLANLKMTNIRRKVMQQLELLVIDEISMVRADTLDAVDTILRATRFRRDEPFGGVQVIYIGDLYQLPPVTVNEEWELLHNYYKSPFFFDSYVVHQQPPVYIELDKIFRQQDSDFVQLLNEVRNNNLTDRGLEMLKSRFVPDFKLSQHPDYIFLTTHNASANHINMEEMRRLKSKVYNYAADIVGDFPEKSYPNEPLLKLRVGAKVMFISNDSKQPRRYFNGKIGTVYELDSYHVKVLCDNEDEPIEVSRETWENVRYNVNRQTNQIEEQKLGTYTQLPLRLAWAITIHKSQGLTFDKAVIDAELAFSSGQVYVALSRCRTLEGLVLTSSIRRESLYVEQTVANYAQQKLPLPQLNEQLKQARLEQDEQVLRSVYNFKFADGQSALLLSTINRNIQKVNTEGAEEVADIRRTVANLKKVGDAFQKQIHELYFTDSDKLKERLNAAAVYFKKELNQLLYHTSHTSAEIYDSELSKEFKEMMKILFAEISLKSYLIDGIVKDYSAEGYYQLRNNFKLPNYTFTIKDIFSETGKKKSEKVKKKEKSLSHLKSLEIFQKTKSVKQTAEERNFAVSTVESHLLKCANEGLIEATEFLEQEVIDGIRELTKQGLSTTEIFESLNGNVSFFEIRMAKIGLKKQE